MISPDSFVFAEVSKTLRERFDGIFVAGEYVEVPSKFPAVTVAEASNNVVTRMRTADRLENAVTLMYETNVFSNLSSGKKAEAREIQEVVDEVFESLGFTRIYCSPQPNLQDSKIYRIFSRYQGVDRPEYTVDEVIHRIYTN